MPLDDSDKLWLEQLLDRKVEELRSELVLARRKEERRRVLAAGNIPAALTTLDIGLEELDERVRKLEKH